jgi:hypothetical protein
MEGRPRWLGRRPGAWLPLTVPTTDRMDVPELKSRAITVGNPRRYSRTGMLPAPGMTIKRGPVGDSGP